MCGKVPSTATRRLAGVLAGLMLLALANASAQQSASYQVTDHVFNAGGHPSGGEILTSASFQITLDSVGEGVVATGLSSASFQLDGGFPTGYPPPGEVLGLRFSDSTTLEWSPEGSIGSYHLYRDLLSSLSGLGYGMCLEPLLLVETTTDREVPTTPGTGFFYLATTENKLAEEGTKGFHTDTTERMGVACP